MIADRLIKTLPVNNWPQFLEQLGLVDMEEHMKVEDAYDLRALKGAH